jgi:large conductance mechanosensitive channel
LRRAISFLRQCSVCSTATTLAEAKKQGAVLPWGNFLTVAINFVIVAWVIFVRARLQ